VLPVSFASCYDSEFYPNDPLCGLFDRGGPSNGILTIRDSYINVARQNNRGYDLPCAIAGP
jgi:iron complex outermembrane recepter protein